MKNLVRAAALILSAALCFCLLAGCGKTEESNGMTLSVCIGGDIQSLDPVRTTSTEDETVLVNLYENLMRISPDRDGSTAVTAGAAKSYETDTNYDGTVTYTFHLRNAKWSDGKNVTAQDFVYAWQRLANPATKSPNAAILSGIAGYAQVQSTGDTSKLQVTAKNDSTLEVTLTGECPWFLTDVCTSAATMPLREDVVQKLKAAAQDANEQARANGQEASATWCSDFSRLVTNGMYRINAYQSGKSLTLKANERYSGTFSGPENITFQFADRPEDAWALYDAKTVDLVSPLPEEQLQILAKDKNWSAVTELNTCTLLFNTAADPFSDPLVRNAFSLAVDRTTLSTDLSAAVKPAAGLVPYGVPETDAEEDFRTAGGDLVSCDPEDYASNCTSAKSLLSQAGYDSGVHFPSVRFLCLKENEQTARTLAGMWSSALQIQVTVESLDSGDLNSALKSEDYDLALGNISGSTNDAAAFLNRWNSSDAGNVVGYRNSAYDTLLSIIASASDEKARLGCLHDAESLLMEDCPLTPLYYTGTAWELRDGLTGLCRDARGWFSFGFVTQSTAG